MDIRVVPRLRECIQMDQLRWCVQPENFFPVCLGLFLQNKLICFGGTLLERGHSCVFLFVWGLFSGISRFVLYLTGVPCWKEELLDFYPSCESVKGLVCFFGC